MLFRGALIILVGGLIFYFGARPAYDYLSGELKWASCASLGDVPAHEQRFASATCNALNEIRSAESDIKIADLEKSLDKKLCQLVDGRPAIKWHGTIIDMDETPVIKTVVLSIELSSKIRLSTDSGLFTAKDVSNTETPENEDSNSEASNNLVLGIKKPKIIDDVMSGDLSDLNPMKSTHITRDHPIYDKLRKLDIKDKVVFSGNFVTDANSKKCVKYANTYEVSNLWSGTDAADYWFEFSELEPL